MQRDPNIHREIHELVQGSTEWDSYRVDHDNASDAPAMMSCSPYKTRSDLVRERATGILPEIDTRTQKLFDDGHRFEALARPLAENIIGDSLYPVTASLGRLSASFDGLTLCETIVWEHKSLNEQIRACATAADLPLMYRVQMEQQLHIVGAEKALFSATRWDEQGNLLEEKHFWYEPDMALRQQIILGWEQFAIDVANYVPAAPEMQHIAAPALALPALVIQTRGEVTQSNLPAFKAAAEQFLAGIKTELETDEDFVNADQAVKDCEKAEGDIEQAKKAATAQMATVDDVLRVADQVKEMIRARRLMLSRLIDTEKLRRKETILNEGKREYAVHIATLENEITPLRLALPQPDFAGAMKGKRTIKGLQDAVNSTLASAKTASSAQAADYRTKQIWCKENAAGHGALFMDMAALITKPMDDFQLVVRTRIDAHLVAEQKKQEDLRAQIAAEEQAKAEAAAQFKLEAERKADSERRAAAEQAERDRVAAETKNQLEQKVAQAAVERQANEATIAKQAQHTSESTLAAARQSAADAAAANVTANATALAEHGRLADLADEQDVARAELAAAKALPEGAELSHAAAGLFAQEGIANFARAHLPPTLKLGDINERLGFTVNADFLASLGFNHTKTDKPGKLYHEIDFPSMCAALCRHISTVQAKYAA